MSRGQENQVVNTAQDQNKEYAQNAQTAFQGAEGAVSNEQGDINNYEGQLGKFAAANPYTEGGAFQTDQNKVLANTSDAAARAAGQAVQGAAVRTGQNAGGAIAATEAMQQQNTRDLSAEEAKANAERLGAGAQYGSEVLKASSVPATLENALADTQARLTSTEAGAGNESLSTQEKAAQTPSFWDQFGSSFASAAGKGLGAWAACWVAAELYGGWEDSRTIVVRAWLFGEFRKHWYGRVLTRLYLRFGERVAERIRTRPIERRLCAWLFGKALNRATQEVR